METIKFLKETPLGNFNVEILKFEESWRIKRLLTKINDKEWYLDFTSQDGRYGLMINKVSSKKILGKQMKQNMIMTLPPHIEKNIHDEFKKLEEEREAAEKLRTENLLSGKEIIEAKYQEGSILDGWTNYDTEICNLLEKNGIAHEVGGWGTKIDDEFIKKVGKKFTYLQVLEYTQPKRDKAEAAKKAKKEKFDKALAEAKETGNPVVIRHHTDDCNDPNEECSMDTITEYIYPDGKIRSTRQHTW